MRNTTQRANDRYKDHLDGQLTTYDLKISLILFSIKASSTDRNHCRPSQMTKYKMVSASFVLLAFSSVFIFVGFCSHVFWTRCPPAGGTGTSSYALQTQPSSLAGKRYQCGFVDIHTIFSAPCIVSVKVGHRFPCLAIFGVISSRPRSQATCK